MKENKAEKRYEDARHGGDFSLVSLWNYFYKLKNGDEEEFVNIQDFGITKESIDKLFRDETSITPEEKYRFSRFGFYLNL